MEEEGLREARKIASFNDRKEVSSQKALEFAGILKQSKKQFIRLALQDTLRRQGIKYAVELRDAA